MKFNIREGDVELRSCAVGLRQEGEHETAEIVQWGKDLCWAVAYWLKDGEEYNLHFVGERPFHKEINPSLFMVLAKMGQQLLEQRQRESHD